MLCVWLRRFGTELFAPQFLQWHHLIANHADDFALFIEFVYGSNDDAVDEHHVTALGLGDFAGRYHLLEIFIRILPIRNLIDDFLPRGCIAGA
jgi:hypothetical protein